ncbi:LEAF RUST 10 DISEASE-RESISTANCE LOCUS RECEPTOR-LIKE PROTEIN KINASE-like 1.4 isoform X1 [Benincasa hispida]|uniref:LEAF RUST 10 DISEASE-RESISTANCE LOCUS RECEPTOR-LIKE PROTEIN KINASE-like 1.4 isoform X1 n=1 Tax=Benincasa hispida TaxID=102211 RepID=UPI0019024DF4|nr:LEAF RUST 10 DISEASE-RESISTANCE LOCUS RECEPTOR-LIKE PROTEIN KINASE-like 1.4 isoform X1 [Benincasa hispida]
MEINPRSFLFFLLGLYLPFFLLLILASAYGEYDWYLNCKDPPKCESIPPNGFPLWINNGAGNCYYPEFMKVDCEREPARTTIEIWGENYQLLGFSMYDQILIIAEIDFSKGFCSPKRNISSKSIHAFIPAVDCREPQIPDKHICSITDFAGIPSENKNLKADAYCISLLVPIAPWLLDHLGNLSTVAQHIKAEFNSKSKVDTEICRSCNVHGSVCGYDLLSNQTSCYCQSQLPSKRFEVCSSSPNAEAPIKAQVPKKAPASDESRNSKKETATRLIIGVSIGGACLVATIIGCCIFFCFRKKKQYAIGSVSKEAGPSPPVSYPISNKDLRPPPLLNSFQSQSIPSYPSSKSDLETPTTNHDIQVFNYAELEKATDNFNRSRELGDGGFGTVYYGKLVDGREVAVKRLYEHNCKRVEQFMNEVDILAHLQHKNLVKLYGCTSRFSQGLLLVYEYIPNGTVADHLHGSRMKLGLLSWPIRLRIAIETANALMYLHRSEIIHRDVKTNNILLDENFTVKVADFGLSRLFPTNVTHVSTAPQGTPGYVDPEYYLCYQLTTKSDVYSFGVVLIELISSLRAVDTDRKRQDINLSNMAVSKIQSRALNELIDPKLGFNENHEFMSEATSVAELAFRCLQQERDLRPTIEEVVEELRKIENDKSSSEMAKVVDIGVVGDDIELVKRTPPSFSPKSVIADNWVSSSSITKSL